MLLGLLRERTLCCVTMPLALTILLVSVLDNNFLVHQVLSMQVGDGIVRGLEVGVADEAIALAQVRLIPRHLWGGNERPKAREGLVQDLLIHHHVQIAHKQLRPHSVTATKATAFVSADAAALIRARLVHSDGLAPDADLVHDLGGIVGVLLAGKLDKTIALVLPRDTFFGEMNVDDRPHLEHQLPHLLIGAALVEIAHVERAFLVLIVMMTRAHGGE